MTGDATRVQVPGGRAYVLGTVQGLASEGDRVQAAFDAFAPRTIGLGVSPEGVAGLMQHRREGSQARVPEPKPVGFKGGEPPKPPRRHKDGTLYEEDIEDPYEYDAEELLTDGEYAYGVTLQRFGAVTLPPRDLLLALEIGERVDVPVFGIDFTEERYGEVFAANVSTFGLLRYGRRMRKLEKRPPRAETARDFAIAWDAYLRRIKGYDAVEKARERQMADAARQLVKEHGDALLIVEAPREEGVLQALRE